MRSTKPKAEERWPNGFCEIHPRVATCNLAGFMEDITHLARIAVIDDEKPKEWSPWGERLSDLDLTALDPPLPKPARVWDKLRLALMFEPPSALKEKRSVDLKYLAGFLVDGIGAKNRKKKEKMINNTIRSISNNLGVYSIKNEAICKSVGISLTILTEPNVDEWEFEFKSNIKKYIEEGSGIKVSGRLLPVIGNQEHSKEIFSMNKKVVLNEMINRYRSNNSMEI